MISEHLLHLIKGAHMDGRDKIRQSMFKNENAFLGAGTSSPMSFFMSSSFDPVIYGSTYLKTGSLIGLPYYYNYETADDLPDSIFERPSLIYPEPPYDRERERKYREQLEESIGSGTTTRKVDKIDRYSPEGIDYANSLLLSDNAKRFSIARAIFLADSYRTSINSGLLFVSFMIMGSLGQGLVIVTKSTERHVMRRAGCYLAALVIGAGCLKITYPMVSSSHASKADRRAIKLGPDYEEGAEEYFSKKAMRNYCMGIKR